MKKLSALVVCFLFNSIQAFGKLPGPLVYVVTPSPKPPEHEGRSAPFYYHNWMKRMDTPNITTTSTTTPKVKTPDLIFAEFESDNGDNMRKSIRRLLEKERFQPKTSTTSRPIYVPDVSGTELPNVESYEPSADEQQKEDKHSEDSTAMEDYFAEYNKLYNNAPTPVYLPSTTVPTTTTSTTTTTTPPPLNVENIWHIIDNEKSYNQYSGKWEEIPLNEDHSEKTNEVTGSTDDNIGINEDDKIDENFALPGFATKSGNGAENESRAIRTEPNFRFPYVDLKTYQIKNAKQPTNSFANNKKSNSMFTNLDNFRDIINPVRGEVREGIALSTGPIDRYNPAQPYLPDYGIGTKKQSSPVSAPPVKAVANLIPPPPPPSKASDSLLPPTNYESFPPYAFSGPPAPPPAPPSSLVASKPSAGDQPPFNVDSYDSPATDDDSNDGPPMMDLGYRYKSPSAQKFVPTLPPVAMSKPFSGYSYDKPSMMDESPAAEPPFKGYSYDKPMMESGPPAPEVDDKPKYGGYHYNKPVATPEDHPPSISYGHHDRPPYLHHDDFPELIYDKHPGDGGMGGMKGGDDMNLNDMGMAPPPPPSDMKPDISPPNDHGFPHDFPHDFKFSFDDHEHDYHHHHHHHTTTTTTTTTEMPRVNRYSYYYLGKKLYYLPLYFSVYFIVYVGALIIKAILRHKIVYPNSFRPNVQSVQTSSFFSKRSVDSLDLSNENLLEVTGRVTRALSDAYEKYKSKDEEL